ncbi:hypothetical protein GCM10025767_21280 [Thalassotalea piscium]
MAISEPVTKCRANYSKSFSLQHSATYITSPQNALVGQKIVVSKPELAKIGVDTMKLKDATFIDNYAIWIDFIRAGLKQDFMSETHVTQFIRAKKNTLDQTNTLQKLQHEFLTNLGFEFDKLNHQAYEVLKRNGLTISDHLLTWGKNNFGYDVTFSSGESYYGSNDTLGLRLDARNGLNVLSIDILDDKKTPLPLKRIGGLLITFLSYLAEKSTSQNLCNSTHEMSLCDGLLESLKKEQKESLLRLINDEKYDEALTEIREIKSVDIEELEFYYGDSEDVLEYMLQGIAEVITWSLDYEYLNAYPKAYFSNISSIIELIKSELNYLSKLYDPSIGHPFYNHLCKIINITEKHIIPINDTSFVVPASDNYLPEYSMISLSNSDYELLDSHNENISCNGESGSFILDLKDWDNIYTYFKNIILADHLILAFDIETV